MLLATCGGGRTDFPPASCSSAGLIATLGHALGATGETEAGAAAAVLLWCRRSRPSGLSSAWRAWHARQSDTETRKRHYGMLPRSVTHYVTVTCSLSRMRRTGDLADLTWLGRAWMGNAEEPSSCARAIARPRRSPLCDLHGRFLISRTRHTCPRRSASAAPAAAQWSHRSTEGTAAICDSRLTGPGAWHSTGTTGTAYLAHDLIPSLPSRSAR